MTNIEKYTVFLIEQYRAKNNLTARNVYNLFRERGIFEYIEKTFEAIHTLDNNFVVAEIENLIKSTE
ncbi:MAG: DUF3791 domain-containing protein [Chitinivibrionia bacterium]|nr:DUF3791 domain-containing protein [Chitinivibrionia bacterium]